MYQKDAIAIPKVSLDFPFTPADFQAIASLVYERSGIVLATHKSDMVYSRLTKRLRALGLTSFRDYKALLAGPAGEQETGFLINAITTNLTKFFREEHHFEHLEQHVLPESWTSTRGEKPRVRIWSAACSSGEEPYSIAMTALTAQEKAGREWDFRILATDLDTATLQKAKTGLYPAVSLKDVPQRYQRFLERTSDGIRAVKALQALITFKPLNLLGNWPMSGSFDAIFCRNVMIYFDAKTKAMLIERMHAILKDGGWLYVGHSESLLDHQSRFKLKGRTIYQKVSS